MKSKRKLDQIDLELISRLAEDARTPYSELADHVELSAPAVSDRIDRLQEQGVIRQFTLDVDRLKLQHRIPVLVRFEVHPTQAEQLYEQIRGVSGIEHVFKQCDGTIVAYGNAPDINPNSWLHEGIEMEKVLSVTIDMVEKYDWSQELDEAAFSLPCPVCKNTVTSEGVTAEIDGEILTFCCPTCKTRYENQLERYRANSD